MSKTKKTIVPRDAELFAAVENNDLKAVQARIAAGVDVNAFGKWEGPVIFAAAERGNREIMAALIAVGANVNCITYPTGQGVKSTPVCYAIEKNQWDTADELLKSGADYVNAAGAAASQASRQFYKFSASDEEWLSSKPRTEKDKAEAKATCELWLQVIRDAVSRGAKIGDYSIWEAVNFKFPELAQILISGGVNVNAAPHGTCVLVRAVEHGSTDIALALIKGGADVNLAARIPSLLVATQKGNLKTMTDLLDAGANINAVADVNLREDIFAKPPPPKPGEAAKPAAPNVAEAATAIIVAVLADKEDAAKLLVQHGADLNIGDKHGLTALAWALKLERPAMVQALKSAGAAEPEFLEGSLGNALLTASSQGDFAKVEMLLGKGAKPNEPIEDREGKHRPLVSAARAGHVRVVQLLLQKGASVDLGADENWTAGITPLMAAARNGHDEVVKSLLAAGADVAAKDSGYEDGGDTALHYAARGGHSAVIKTLLAGGAKVNAKAKGGATPLLAAVGNQHHDAMKTLLENGADPNAGSSSNAGPLYNAAMKKDVAAINMLLAHGAKPGPVGKKMDFVPLNIAAYEGFMEIVELLLKAGAPVDAQGVRGSTALADGALRGREDVVKALLAAGANPNLANSDGFTPLMAAIRSHNAEVVQMMLSAGANVHAMDAEGRTALKIAGDDKTGKILPLIQAAVEQQPAPEPARPKAKSPASADEDDEDEEDDDFEEAPDFTAAAATAEFQAALREMEKLCGSKPKALGDFPGISTFNVSREKAETILSANHEPFLKKGAYLFRQHRDTGDKTDKLALAPTSDWADLLRAFQTNGANYDLAPADIARWLKKLSSRQPFVVTGVGWDWMEGRFSSPIKNGRKLAHEMYEFCPDIVDQGIGSVKELARALEKNGYFFFWWD